MSGQRDYGSFREDMVLSCEHIVLVAQRASDDELLDERSAFHGDVLHRLTVLGEAAKHVPEDVRARGPEIPWTRIAGLRDMIVHYYFGLKGPLIIAAVRESVPAALPPLRSLLAEIDAEGAQ